MEGGDERLVGSYTNNVGYEEHSHHESKSRLYYSLIIFLNLLILKRDTFGKTEFSSSEFFLARESRHITFGS